MAVASRRGDARLLSVVTMGGGGGRSALCTAARMSARAEMVAVSRRFQRVALVGNAAMRSIVARSVRGRYKGKLSDGLLLVSHGR